MKKAGKYLKLGFSAYSCISFHEFPAPHVPRDKRRKLQYHSANRTTKTENHTETCLQFPNFTRTSKMLNKHNIY